MQTFVHRVDITGDVDVLPNAPQPRHQARLRSERVAQFERWLDCAPGRIRTCDTRFRRAVLYPLSYEGWRA